MSHEKLNKIIATLGKEADPPPIINLLDREKYSSWRKNLIIKIVQEKLMTQSELTKALGCSWNTIWKIINY